MKSSRRKEGAGRIMGHGKATDNSAEFHAVLSGQFLQRYTDLFQALAQPVQHVALVNALAEVNDCDEMGLESFYRHGPISCMRYPEPAASFPPPPICPYTQLKQYYWLDFASVLPPLLLAVQPHHTVLDMCAAPGGKSLVLAMQLLKGTPATVAAAAEQQGQQTNGAALSADLLQQLHIEQQMPEHAAADQALQQQHLPLQQQQQQDADELQAREPIAGDQAQGDLSDDGSNCSSTAADTAEAEVDSATSHASSASSSQPGRLVSNELDPVRRQRLNSVLAGYIPGSLRRRVRVTGNDAAKHWSKFEEGMYDRVLLDAPCSSERHVVLQAVESGGVVPTGSWSIEHCKKLAALQLQMLLSGLRALKPGGVLVYSTCSLIDMENDQVVQRALQQWQQSVGSKQCHECEVVPVGAWGLSDEEHLAGAERTQHGLLCTPDKQGWGPIYVAMLRKLP